MLKISIFIILSSLAFGSFAQSEDTHWSDAAVNELKTKEFPDKIKNVWLSYIRALDGTNFVLLRYELKDNGFHNYFDRLYSTDGNLLVKTKNTQQITPLNAKTAFVNGSMVQPAQEWDLTDRKLIGTSKYKYLIIKDREMPRELKANEKAFRTEVRVIENIIGVVETKDTLKPAGKLKTAYALDSSLNVVSQIGPILDINSRPTYVFIKSKEGIEKPYNWDLTPQGSEKVTEFNKFQKNLEIKNQKRADDYKKDQERQAAEAKALVELKKANEACFERAKANRNLTEAYRCGVNLGDKYGNWLLEEREADVEAIGQALKAANMHYSIEFKLRQRYKILNGLGHKNMKALDMAEASDEARRNREAIAAAAARAAGSNNANPADYNKSYKDIMWQQGVNKGGPTYDQINSGGK